MSSPDLLDATPDDRAPDDLVEAGSYRTEAEGFEHGLVVLAMGRPFWLMPAEGCYRLLVEPAVRAAAHEQLAIFDRESVGWPPPLPAAPATRQADFVTPLLWVLTVLAVFHGQGEWPGRWEAAGALDATAVFDRGEWWRLFTALFLHADVGHLLSNALCGLFVFSAVLATLGRWRGWLLLGCGAGAGNLAAAALHFPQPYRSLGASTAVFTGLGLLTGRAIRAMRQTGTRHGWRGVFAPLGSGAVLLLLYGAGGPDVDVLAHLTGFGAGLALGYVVSSQ